MGDHIDNIDTRTGKVLTPEDIERRLRDQGLCIRCGRVKTHKRTFFLQLMPLSKEVENCICLKCQNQLNSVPFHIGVRSRSQNSQTSQRARSLDGSFDYNENSINAITSDSKGHETHEVGRFGESSHSLEVNHDSFERILRDMIANENDMNTIVRSLKEMRNIAHIERHQCLSSLKSVMKKLLSVLDLHLQSELVADEALNLFLVISSVDEERNRTVGSKGGITYTTQIMAAYPNNMKIQALACTLLTNFAKERDNCRDIVRNEDIKWIFRACESNDINCEVAILAFDLFIVLLESIEISEDNVQRVMTISTTLVEKFRNDEYVCKTGLAAVSVASDHVRVVSNARNIATIVSNCLSFHKRKTDVEVATIKTLKNMIRKDWMISNVPISLLTNLNNILDRQLSDPSNDEKKNLHKEIMEFYQLLLSKECITCKNVLDSGFLTRLYMTMYVNLTDSSEIIRTGMTIIVYLAERFTSLVNVRSCYELINVAIGIHAHDSMLMIEAQRIIRSSVINEEVAVDVSESGIMTTFHDITKNFQNDENVIHEVLCTIHSLCNFDHTWKEVEYHFPDVIVQSMKAHPLSLRIQVVGCKALHALRVNPLTSEVQLLRECVMDVIIEAMQEFQYDRDILSNGCEALRKSMFNPDNAAVFITGSAKILPVLSSVSQENPHLREEIEGLIEDIQRVLDTDIQQSEDYE